MSQHLPLKDCLIIFDLDGTLVDTAPDILAALNHTLTEAGFKPAPDDTIRALISAGAKTMLRTALTLQDAPFAEPQITAMFDALLAYYKDNIAIHSQPYSGCVDSLTRLANAGAHLAICTNKRQVQAEALIDSLGLSSRFAAIVGADAVTSPKPNGFHIQETIRRAGCVGKTSIMIGDSETDERAAFNAELPFILIPFGYGPIADKPAGNRFVLNNYTDLSIDLVVSLIANQAAAKASPSSIPDV